VAAREAYSFDASIDRLVDVWEQARRQYLAKPIAARRPPVEEGVPLLRLDFGAASNGARPPSLPRRVVRKLRAETIGRASERRRQRLARELRAGPAPQ
jgi:hypothetical protein